MDPDKTTIKGTLGSLLVETGHHEQGRPLLLELFERSDKNLDRGISALYLAIAAKRCSDPKAAKEWGERALQEFPDPWVTHRLQVESLSCVTGTNLGK